MMLVNNPGDWGHVYAPLLHAKWHGWTFTDVIFPFFLWIVGVAIPLSASKRLATGQSRADLLVHGIKRAVIIFGIGFLLNSFSYLTNGSILRLGFMPWLHDYATSVRIPGVLQRIAICYVIALALFLRFSWRGLCVSIGSLLLGYWAMMMLLPVPGCGVGSLTPDCNLAGFIDNQVLNGPVIGTHVWKTSKTWDPEGILSTLPAVATCLFGILTGNLLAKPMPAAEKVSWLFTAGAVATVAGLAWDMAFPINKSLWTSSFVLLMAGLSATTFAVLYWLVDVHGLKRFSRPFAIYGMNAIAVFVLSGVLGRLVVDIKLPGGATLKKAAYDSFRGFFNDPRNSSLLWAILWVLLLYAIAWAMHRKKWYVKF